MSNNRFAQQQAQRNSDEVRDLRAEVAQLKGLLSEARMQREGDCVEETLRATDNAEFGQAILANQSSADVTHTEPRIQGGDLHVDTTVSTLCSNSSER